MRMNLGLILPEMNFRTQVVSPTAYVCLSPNKKKCGVSGMLHTCASTSMLPTVYLPLQAHVYPTVKKDKKHTVRPALLSTFESAVTVPRFCMYASAFCILSAYYCIPAAFSACVSRVL